MLPCSHSLGVPSSKPSDVRTQPGVTAETRRKKLEERRKKSRGKKRQAEARARNMIDRM